MLNGGLLGTSKPEKANPIVAGIDINKPRAAAVPTALCIGIDNDNKVGTPIVPAPTPIKDDTKPMIKDEKLFIIFDFGNLLLNLSEFFINIFNATIKATIANTYFSSLEVKNFPENPPKRAPKNIPNPHFFITSISIDPFL